MRERAKAIDEFVRRHMPQLLRDLDRLVRIPSVSRPGEGTAEHPYGIECTRALHLALDMARERGMETRSRDNHYGTALYGQGTHTIGIFSHLDVVEAGENWLYPPFQCTERAGFIIGRGVGDDKVAALLGIYTALAMQELGIAPHTRLLVYFGCCEERGMLDMAHYTAQEPLPDFSLVPDIKFPVCVGERGSVRFLLEAPRTLESGIIVRGGSDSAKSVDRAEAVLPGCGGELGKLLLAAAQENDNITLAWEGGDLHVAARGRLPASGDPRRGLNANLVLFSLLSRVLPAGDRELFRQAACMMGQGGCGLGLDCSDEMSGELLCNCICARTEEGRLKLRFDLRCPVTASSRSIMDRVRAAAAEAGWTISGLTGSDGWYFPGEDPRVQLLCDAWEEVSGQRGQPYINSGGTYASRLKNAVGFGPMDTTRCPFLPPGHGSIHAPDEARSITTIENALRTYLRAVDALDHWYSGQP